MIFLVLAVLSQVAIAQKPAFKVMASRGAQVQAGSQWKTLVNGSTLSSKDIFRLAEGGYISLMHQTGKTLEYNKAATYKVADLETKIQSGTDNFTKKYADYVMNSVSATQISKTDMGEGGAVYRKAIMQDTPEQKTNLRLMASRYNKLLPGEEVVIYWSAPQSRSSFFTISLLTNLPSETVIYNDTVYNNKYSLSKLFSFIKPEQSYILEVEFVAKENGSKDRCEIKVPTEEFLKEIQTELQPIKSSLDPTQAVDLLILAAFFEEKGLFLYANYYWKLALEKSGNPLDYLRAYEVFKANYGF